MRRRGRSPTRYIGTSSATEDDIMDEDDQNELVEAIRLEAEQQTKNFRRYFTYIGAGAIVIAISDPFICQEECAQQLTSCWTHSIFSAIFHGVAVVLARRASNGQDFHWFLLTFAFVAIPMILWIMGLFHEDIEHLHIGLLLSNMITFSGCLLLRWDDHSTSIAIGDLHDSKYGHKTL